MSRDDRDGRGGHRVGYRTARHADSWKHTVRRLANKRRRRVRADDETFDGRHRHDALWDMW